MQQQCGTCHGPVTSHHEAFQIEHPARDERGRFLYETVVDKKTGQKVERQIMLEVDARGLGHWSCNNGCKKRKGVRTHNKDGAGIPLPTTRDIVVMNGRSA